MRLRDIMIAVLIESLLFAGWLLLCRSIAPEPQITIPTILGGGTGTKLEELPVLLVEP
jgi:hypothetical protein